MSETEKVTEPKEGNTNYVRWQVSEQIKQALTNDKQLATQIYAWLRTQGLKLTDY